MTTTVYRPATSSTGDVSITGDISASGTINSIGINSSADANVITIDADENISIAKAALESWNASYTGFELGGNATMMGKTAGGASGNFQIMQNAFFHSGGTYKYQDTDQASRINQTNGTITLSVVVSGSADSNITWNDSLHVDNSGRVGVGTSGVNARLHVDQSSTSGATPVLYLDQADVSEQFIRFDATEATGNAVEDVGAKSLTTTKFIRININGADLYLQAGTIA